MNSVFDVAVIGLGATGAATVYDLAGRGVRVVGIDQFAPPHGNGSSHGHTRLIRKAYFEHPNYVPLLERAYELWSNLEQNSGERLFLNTGLLLVSHPEGPIGQGTILSSEKYGIPLDRLTSAESMREFPWFKIPPDFVGLFEPTAGCLLIEKSVGAFLRVARARGAEIITGQAVRTVRTEKSQTQITTDQGTIHAKKVVVAAGAWASELVPELRRHLSVHRVPIFWFQNDIDFSAASDSPAFGFALESGFFYGFPDIEGRGVKIGLHKTQGKIDEPSNLSQNISDEDTRPVEEFLSQHLPRLGRKRIDHSVCMYTMSPDEHFVVGQLPENDNMIVASPCSGHGFKFAPVMAQAIGDLATAGRTNLPIQFLSIDRLIRA